MTPYGIQPASRWSKKKTKETKETKRTRENKNYVLERSCTISERCSERLKGLNGDDAFVVVVVDEMSVILPITRWILSPTQKFRFNDVALRFHCIARLVSHAIGSIVCALHSHSRASLRCMRARNHTRQMLNQHELNVWRRRHRA